MNRKDHINVRRIVNEHDRQAALNVLRSVYVAEKQWANREGDILPLADLLSDDVAWFLSRWQDTPTGVVRVLFQLPLALYRSYGIKPLDPALDVERFLTTNRVAEVGRFAVLPEARGQIMVAASLIKAAARETLARRYTHLITDVFEDDPNSPYEFHTRVLGFVPVATHDHGELAGAAGRRITMLLDLAKAYQRLAAKNNWIFRYIFEGDWPTEWKPAAGAEL